MGLIPSFRELLVDDKIMVILAETGQKLMDPLDLEQLLLLPREAFCEVMKTKSDEEVTAFNWIMGQRLRRSLEKCELKLERSERLRTKALELSLVRKQETPIRRFVEPAEDQKLPVVSKHIEYPQHIEDTHLTPLLPEGTSLH
ncbi:hypothetical protein F2Q68_00014711 [Brassica cretica]|uniref:Uncharacterized protein n=1 Tax=Brassica cretica TaxID=69181 RepID=A0A8S9HRI0_BRACR|nr:hypothetical protein F2Q68_00014711 [Brassica cretica]